MSLHSSVIFLHQKLEHLCGDPIVPRHFSILRLFKALCASDVRLGDPLLLLALETLIYHLQTDLKHTLTI